MTHRTFTVPFWIRQTAQGSLLLVLSAATLLAQHNAGITGIVRDTHGAPQMGVAVELAGAGAAQTVLTDLQGRYQINDVSPGVYQLRATATLYLPTLRRQLHLQSNFRPVVNLTMTGLLDEATWLPATHRQPGETADDWKWTLRSSANRPMLRLANDDAVDPALSDAQRPQGQTQAMLLGISSMGGFGGGGLREGVALAHRTADGRTTALFHGSLSQVQYQGASASLAMSGTVQTDSGPLIERRVSARVRSLPQIRSTRGSGLREAEFASGQRSHLGDLAVLEFGTETQLLQAEHSRLVTRPFVQITSHPVNGWSVRYAIASAPHLTRYESIGADESHAPTAIETGDALHTEVGRHQELRVRHGGPRVRLQVAYHHDVQQRTAISGGFLTAADGDSKRSGSSEPYRAEGVSVDTSSRTFRIFARGIVSDGGSALLAVPVWDGVTLSAGYINGVGLNVPSKNIVGASRSAALQKGPAAARSQSVLLALEGKVDRTGTRWSTSYRWQPGALVGVLLPYEAPDVSPYLGVHVQQSLPSSMLLPAGLEITIDGSNLLAEGYQRTSIQARDAVLTSALRELKAGFAFTF